MKCKLIILFVLVIEFCSAQFIQLDEVSKATAVVPCNPNTFWSVRFDPSNFNTTIVSEYSLLGNIVTSTGNNIYNCPGISIAYSNSFDSTFIGEKLYTTDYLTFNNLYSYSGSNWVNIDSLKSLLFISLRRK